VVFQDNSRVGQQQTGTMEPGALVWQLVISTILAIMILLFPVFGIAFAGCDDYFIAITEIQMISSDFGKMVDNSMKLKVN